ncbi:hypothetical protein BD779DRAFT_339228 [Infundibulicybe gibba]|nr:hypothetical protein BD779DRAFT_339228 [Infundibulicybe gibba]
MVLTTDGTVKSIVTGAKAPHYILNGQDDRSFIHLSTTLDEKSSSSPQPLSRPCTHTMAPMTTTTTLPVQSPILIAETTNQNHAPREANKHIAIIVGSVVGSVITLGIILIVVFYYRRRKRVIGNYAMGPLQASLPVSKKAFTSPGYHNHGLSFSPVATASTVSLPHTTDPSCKSIYLVHSNVEDHKIGVAV